MAKGKKPKRQRILPRCKAFLLCQSTIVESETNNLSIIRIFNRFTFNSFPSQTWPFTVFAQLVGGVGRYVMVIEVHSLHDGEVIARGEGAIEFTDRVGSQNITIPVPPLILQQAGAYDVVLLADGSEIDRQQFTAVSEEESPDENNGQDEDNEESS